MAKLNRDIRFGSTVLVKAELRFMLYAGLKAQVSSAWLLQCLQHVCLWVSGVSDVKNANDTVIQTKKWLFFLKVLSVTVQSDYISL